MSSSIFVDTSQVADFAHSLKAKSAEYDIAVGRQRRAANDIRTAAREMKAKVKDREDALIALAVKGQTALSQIDARIAELGRQNHGLQVAIGREIEANREGDSGAPVSSTITANSQAMERNNGEIERLQARINPIRTFLGQTLGEFQNILERKINKSKRIIEGANNLDSIVSGMNYVAFRLQTARRPIRIYAQSVFGTDEQAAAGVDTLRRGLPTFVGQVIPPGSDIGADYNAMIDNLKAFKANGLNPAPVIIPTPPPAVTEPFVDIPIAPVSSATQSDDDNSAWRGGFWQDAGHIWDNVDDQKPLTAAWNFFGDALHDLNAAAAVANGYIDPVADVASIGIVGGVLAGAFLPAAAAGAGVAGAAGAGGGTAGAIVPDAVFAPGTFWPGFTRIVVP